MTSAPPADLVRARRMLASGAVIMVAGLGVAGTASRAIGGYVVVLGWLLFVAAIHAFGRTGAA